MWYTYVMTIYRVIIGEDWRNTKSLASCPTLAKAKESAKAYALNGWYFAIYKATDENPAGELVGRWIYQSGNMKKFYMPGERPVKKKSFWA